MRLAKFLARAGVASRRAAEEIVCAGRVTVDGVVVADPARDVGASDVVALDGASVQVVQDKAVYALNKPRGVVSTARDPQGRPTVYDLIADVGQFLGTVGRLDQDTSGLLLLTNDTQFAERVTNPDQHVPKTYLVKASTRLSDEQLDQLRNGIVLSDGPTRPAIVNRVRDSAKYSFIEITIDEGRNRQVRRMLEALDSKVLKLVRTAIGPISIGDLQIGHYRELTSTEVNQLGSRRSHQLLP